jgi:hypothetical protein
MGLADIDEEEIDLAFVLGGEGVEAPNLGAEGGSSIGAEDEGDGAGGGEL